MVLHVNWMGWIWNGIGYLWAGEGIEHITMLMTYTSRNVLKSELFSIKSYFYLAPSAKAVKVTNVRVDIKQIYMKMLAIYHLQLFPSKHLLKPN